MLQGVNFITLTDMVGLVQVSRLSPGRATDDYRSRAVRAFQPLSLAWLHGKIGIDAYTQLSTPRNSQLNN